MVMRVVVAVLLVLMVFEMLDLDPHANAPGIRRRGAIYEDKSQQREHQKLFHKIGLNLS